MLICNYDPVSGEYLSTEEADPSPLEPGRWLIPAHATTMAAPPPMAGMAAIWTGEGWEAVEDHRGTTAWLADGTEMVVTMPGPLPDGWSATFVPRIPDAISRRQFWQQAAVAGLISEDEALVAMATGALPAVLQTVIDGLPAGGQFAARMALAAETFARGHPLTAAIAGALAIDADTFFIAAAAL